jgi:hypothetical protein
MAEVTEHGKRLLIDHINLDHADAHVLIACHHELKEIERVSLRTFSPEQNKEIELGEHVRSQCVRCDGFILAPADEPDAHLSHDPAVAIVADIAGERLSIPVKEPQ